MASLLASTDSKGVLEKAVLEFHEGQAVEVNVGPFAGMIAEITNIGPGERISILLEVLGRPIEATVDSSDVSGA